LWLLVSLSGLPSHFGTNLVRLAVVDCRFSTLQSTGGQQALQHSSRSRQELSDLLSLAIFEETVAEILFFKGALLHCGEYQQQDNK